MTPFKQEVIELDKKGLKRSLRLIESESAAWFVIGGRKILNLCSNNYLGLANDKRLKEAAVEAIQKYGFGSGASRLVCGNMKPHRDLEQRLAEFKKTDACLVYNSGYSANVGIVSALVDKGDIVFCDRLNHASIIDGIILSRAELKRYPHKDMQALEDLLRKSTNFKKRLIVSDSVFSMDGDIAPIEKLIELANRYNCLLMIDEAHATGVLGKKGRGALEYLSLEHKKNNIIQMGTLSKALGGFGAYVCGSQDLIEYLINKSRAFIYTTSLPPAIAAANIVAIDIVEQDVDLKLRLKENTEFFRKRLNDLGFNTLDSQTPITPLLTKDPKVTMDFSQRLFDAGIFAQGIRPPAVPQGKSRVRITIMATHLREDLEFALSNLERIAKELCLI